MSKRRYGLSEEKIQAYIKEGRGQGEGENYKPWINIHDFPSQGRVSRCFSWKTGRVLISCSFNCIMLSDIVQSLPLV